MTAEATRQEIVYVTGAISPQIQEEIAAVAAVLQSWGYRTQVVAPMTRPFRADLAAAGVPAREVGDPSGDSLRARWSDARDLAAAVRTTRPMLVHAHGLHASIAALLSRRGSAEHVPLVISPHLSPHLLQEHPHMGLRRRACRWALARSEAIVVPTETQRKELAEIDARAASRAEKVPYGIFARSQPPSLDLGHRRKLLGITSSAVVIGCVVDDLQSAAIAAFLDAAAELCMDYPSLEFALIGRGVDSPECHQMAHDRGLLGAAVFVDPREHLRRAIASLNVLVTPQSGWPSGMLALEALSVDVGVVALEGGEVAEMLAQSPQVTVVPKDGSVSLGEGIIRQLRAASQRMEPERELAESSAISSFLVSREFFDLEEAWQAPSRRASREDATSTGPDIAASFDPTLSARALIAIYQRLLDESETG